MNNSIKKEINIEILLPLALNILIFGMIYKNQNLFDFFVDIFCFVAAISLSILTLFKSPRNRDGFYRNIGYSFFIISAIILLKFIFKALIPNNKEIMDITSLVIIYSINIFIIISLVISENIKKGESIAFFIAVVLLITIYSIISVRYWEKSTIINCTCLIGINIIQLEILWGKKELRSEVYYHIGYVILLSLFELSSILNLINYEIYLYVSATLRYIVFYWLYIVVEERFYFKSYHIEEYNLRDMQNTYKELNKILLKKNKELLEIKRSIEKSENKKRKLMEQVKDGIIMLSYNKITYINEVVQGFFQRDNKADVVGKTISEIINEYKNDGIVYKNIKLKSVDFYSSKILVGKLYKVFDIAKNNNDFSIYFFKLNNSEGVLYCKDNTFIKRSNKLRNEYEEYLKEEKLKDEFYSNISHELRTPINIIYSAIQLNLLHLEEKRKAKLLENNNIIKQNCLRLIRTINNFIDTNKVTEGYLKPMLKVHNIVYVVENIAMACNRYLEKVDKILIFDAEEEEIYVKIDKEMMERIIMNLLSNVVKYGERGGEVNINILNKDDIIIEVKHNLCSISEENMPYIFDKFSKLNKSLNREREGCGLGLFLSKALVELQGGSISLESDKKYGTKFIIKLPKPSDIDLNSIDIEEEFKIENVNNKVDTEFSDIYL